MSKKRFATLRKALKQSCEIWVHRDGDDRVYVANGYFMVWMPVQCYETYLGDVLPDVSENTRWTWRSKEKRWYSHGQDLGAFVSRFQGDDDSTLSGVSQWIIADYGEYGAGKLVLSDIAVIMVDSLMFDACQTLVGGAIYASDRNKPVWFSGDDGYGAFLLPIRYDAEKMVRNLRQIAERFPGVFLEA